LLIRWSALSVAQAPELTVKGSICGALNTVNHRERLLGLDAVSKELVSPVVRPFDKLRMNGNWASRRAW